MFFSSLFKYHLNLSSIHAKIGRKSLAKLETFFSSCTVCWLLLTLLSFNFRIRAVPCQTFHCLLYNVCLPKGMKCVPVHFSGLGMYNLQRFFQACLNIISYWLRPKQKLAWSVLPSSKPCFRCWQRKDSILLSLNFRIRGKRIFYVSYLPNLNWFFIKRKERTGLHFYANATSIFISVPGWLQSYENWLAFSLTTSFTQKQLSSCERVELATREKKTWIMM